MADQLKLYHKIFPIIFIVVCGFLFISFGWIGYATLTERSGISGDWYYYYQLTRPQFFIFNFSVAFIAIGLALFQIKFLIDRNSKSLTKTFWIFALFIGMLIVAEIILSTRFAGKG